MAVTATKAFPSDTTLLGDTTSVDSTAFAEPATNAAGAISDAAPAVAPIVLFSAFVDVRLLVAIPFALVDVVPAPKTSFALLLANATLWLGTRFA